MHWTAHAGLWLQQAVTALSDTIITKPIAAPPDWFARLAAIASGLVSLALLAVLAVLVPVVWRFRKSYERVHEMLDRLSRDIAPIARHTATIADNVEHVTTTIRGDIDEVSRTVTAANERIHDAMRITERRLHAFNALLAVVQREAEQLVIGAAATVRGARVGIATFGDEMSSDLDVEDDLLDDVPDEETSAGERDDDEDQPATARRRGPRVRRHPR